MILQFSGKWALILGGSCDLALALAARMVEMDLFPVLTYRNHTGKKKISEKLNNLAGRFDTAHITMGDRDTINHLSGKFKNTFDYLVDFAQGDLEALVSTANEDDIYRYFAENISFRAVLLKKISRAMLTQKRGRLIFVSSSSAERPNPGQGFYAASKLASEAIYRNLGIELGGHGITTISLRPGYIDAGRGKTFLGNGGENITDKIPIKRALTCKEVVDTLLFYLSDNASGFNATEILIDGGLTAGK